MLTVKQLEEFLKDIPAKDAKVEVEYKDIVIYFRDEEFNEDVCSSISVE